MQSLFVLSVFYPNKEEAAGQNFLVRTEVLTNHIRLGKFNDIFSTETAVCGFLCLFSLDALDIPLFSIDLIDSFCFDAVGRGDALRAPCQLFLNCVSNRLVKGSNRADHFDGVRNDVVSA